MKTTIEQKQEEQQRAAAILLAIEIASNFKLYSYRILTHENFYQRTIELVQIFEKSLQKPKKSKNG